MLTMETYYQEILDKLEMLMEKQDFQAAYSILQTEISMPYVPLDALERFKQLEAECHDLLHENDKALKYDETDLDVLLFSGQEEKQYLAIELLRKSNIRNHLDLVQRYFDQDEQGGMIRSLLIEALIEQDVYEEMCVKVEGMDVSFFPRYLELPKDQEAFRHAKQKIRDYFENEDPSFMQMVFSLMEEESLLRLPFSLSEDEVDLFIASILQLAYEARGDAQEFERFVSEKNLAYGDVHELLLYKRIA